MNLLAILVAKYLILLPICVAVIYFFLQSKNKKKYILTFGIPSVILTYLLALLAGYLYYDPRPFVSEHITPLLYHIPDNGFPSDHVLLASLIASIATYINKKLGIALWLIVILIALSRVYVGVHHTIDVVGSMLIALIAVFSTRLFLKRLRKS